MKMKKCKKLLLVAMFLGITFSISVNCYAKDDKKTILVTTKEEEDISSISQEILDEVNESGVECTVCSEDFGILTLEVDSSKEDSVINTINNIPGVEEAQKDYELTIEKNFSVVNETDEYFDYQWGLKNTGQTVGQAGIEGIDINILPAWDITKGEETVVVGVIDTGVDISHPDLENNIYVNEEEIPGNNIDDDNNGYIDDVNGWDFANQDNTVYDSYSNDMHGTHVSGIIAAESNDIGVVGVAPNIKVLPIKFIEDSYGTTSDAIQAISYAKLMGVKIVNCSWGGKESNPALKQAMENSGILFVCAAGNDYADTQSTPVYPACYDLDNIISVGAIDNRGDIADFSNYGQDVDVLAPGVYIASTGPDDSYLFGSGTSMAAPFVTGIAALQKSIDSDISASELSEKITNNVVQDNKYNGKVNSSGYVDAFLVLDN